MNTFLWVAGILLVIVGGGWMVLNHMNRPMLEKEYKELGEKLLRESDEVTRAYRSMQRIDVFLKRRKNKENRSYSRGFFVGGIIILLIQAARVLR